MYKLWNMLAEMKSDAYEWVELSHSMNNDSPVWSGIPAGSVEVSKTVFDWGNPMLECLIQTFKFPGQYGTHIDFPGHFVKDMPLSEAFCAQRWRISRPMKRNTERFPTAPLWHCVPTGIKIGRIWIS